LPKLILAVLSVGVLSILSCGPGGLPGGSSQGNRSDPLTITTTKLPAGIVGIYYTARLNAAGGVPPYRWHVKEGTLPSGIVLDSEAGEISGTPTEFTKSALTFSVGDSTVPQQEESRVALRLEVDPDHLMVVTPGLPQAIIGKPYSVTLEAAGGTLPYTWSIAQGALPPGLDLDPLSGVIQGNPSQGGTSVFVIQVTDSSTPPISVAYRIPPRTEGDSLMP
jgi:hypothetical protein